MRRPDLEHIIRAAAEVSGDQEIVIVGSQAILGEFPEAPQGLLLSPEADVFPRNHPEQADEIDGALGDGSMFHDTHDYYAHGVGPETATLPEGWEERLVPICNENTRQATGWCLEAHDLMLSKLAAGRDKDRAFVEEALRHRLVDPATLRERLAVMPVSSQRRTSLEASLEGLVSRASRGP